MSPAAASPGTRRARGRWLAAALTLALAMGGLLAASATGAQEVPQLLVSASPDRSSARPLHGTTLGSDAA